MLLPHVEQQCPPKDCYFLSEYRVSHSSDHHEMLRVCGSVVIETLSHKPEGCGFQTQLGEWIFSIYLILPAALTPGVYSASNRNEYHKENNNVSGE
jgi:hypothetical protein